MTRYWALRHTRLHLEVDSGSTPCPHHILVSPYSALNAFTSHNSTPSFYTARLIISHRTCQTVFAGRQRPGRTSSFSWPDVSPAFVAQTITYYCEAEWTNSAFARYRRGWIVNGIVGLQRTKARTDHCRNDFHNALIKKPDTLKDCHPDATSGTYAVFGPSSILPLYLYLCQHLILDVVNSTN